MLRSFVLAAVLAAAASAADPDLLRLVMPDAQVVVGADLTRVKASPFGQFALAKMDAEKQRHLQALSTVTGFDATRDLTEVLAASAAAGGPGPALVLAKGIFDVPRILTFLQTLGVTPEEYKGVQVIVPNATHNGLERQNALAFLSGAVAVFGEIDAVKAAIDRRDASSPLNPELLSKVNQLSGMEDAWGVVIGPLKGLGGSSGNKSVDGILKGELVQNIQQVSGGVKLGDRVEVSAEAVAGSEKDATALADVAKFLFSMAQMSGNNPASQLVSLIQNFEATAQAAVVRLSFAVSESDLEKLIQSAEQKHSRAAAKVQ